LSYNSTKRSSRSLDILACGRFFKTFRRPGTAFSCLGSVFPRGQTKGEHDSVSNPAPPPALPDGDELDLLTTHSTRTGAKHTHKRWRRVSEL
jgi:hypothetical protein